MLRRGTLCFFVNVGHDDDDGKLYIEQVLQAVGAKADHGRWKDRIKTDEPRRSRNHARRTVTVFSEAEKSCLPSIPKHCTCRLYPHDVSQRRSDHLRCA